MIQNSSEWSIIFRNSPFSLPFKTWNFMIVLISGTLCIYTYMHIAQVLPCEMLIPPMQNNYGSRRLCLQNFYALPSATACFGDSGGPLVVCEGDRIVLIGVASSIKNPIHDLVSLVQSFTAARCDKDKTVSAYVNIQQYLPWIRSKIGEGNNWSFVKKTLLIVFKI